MPNLGGDHEPAVDTREVEVVNEYLVVDAKLNLGNTRVGRQQVYGIELVFAGLTCGLRGAAVCNDFAVLGHRHCSKNTLG